ncbi:uncharacterized protein LOC123555272 [Mercenaria mercenaria]|uniref:uncharacterized protein LOC123555272 n=1 Tax=Mercenaria mercenaria TaxID=6596 RepID=UPI00234EA8E1|nr:uncharacterized protein LOC123555272 [Mercenaria mercenaria]
MANVHEKLRLLQPSFLLIEQLFDVKDNHLCLEKMICLLETEMPNEEHNPFKYYSRFLTNSHHDFDAAAFNEIESLERNFPKLSKIIESIEYGQNANTSRNCNLRFSECSKTQSELIAIADAYSDDNILKHGFPTRTRRGSGCFWGGVGCAVLGGGCAICATSTLGTCTAACGPAAAAACSGFGLGCVVG